MIREAGNKDKASQSAEINYISQKCNLGQA